MTRIAPGRRLRDAISVNKPLQIVGTINAYTALLAKQVGFDAIYLSGAGVANANFGLPDLGMTSLDNVCEQITKLTQAVDLPLLVDADTGWGSLLNIAHTVHSIEKAGAAGLHLEDQQFPKRCGHRPGKQLISPKQMQARITSAVHARQDNAFVIMARTDAIADEGIEKAIERAKAYVSAGADMIFAEAVTTLTDYKTLTQALTVPVLANLTEFGKTPLFTAKELSEAGVSMALYPLSAFRAMNQAALRVFEAIKAYGTQASELNNMQTREALYKSLNYNAFEAQLDQELQ